MRYFLSILIVIFSLFFSTAYANDSAWSLLEEGGKIVFIRHAYAPGGGDPDNFVIEDCSTQRNLNQQGIDQSISMGQEFSKRDIPIQQVYSSQWCRCKDTASYAFGDYQELSSLNSTFEGKFRQNHQRQIKELKEWIKSRRFPWIPSWDTLRFKLLTMPRVTVFSSPKGLPTAIAQSPTRS